MSTEDNLAFKFHPSYFSQRSTYFQTLQDAKDFESNIIPQTPPIQISTPHGVKMLGVNKQLQSDLNQTITSAPVSGDSSLPLILYTPPLASDESKASFEMFQKLFYLLVVVDIALIMLSYLRDLSTESMNHTTTIWTHLYFAFGMMWEFYGMISVRSGNSVLLSLFLSIYTGSFLFNFVTMASYFNVMRCLFQFVILCLGMLIRSRLMYAMMNARSATDWNL